MRRKRVSSELIDDKEENEAWSFSWFRDHRQGRDTHQCEER